MLRHSVQSEPSSIKWLGHDVHAKGPAAVESENNFHNEWAFELSTISFKENYRCTFYSSDDTFYNQTRSWRILQDIQDGIHQLLISILLDILHTDHDVDHCMYDSSNNI